LDRAPTRANGHPARPIEGCDLRGAGNNVAVVVAVIAVIIVVVHTIPLGVIDRHGEW
jgi:hypothetical protein